MIDGGLVGTSNHASDMVDAITEQNPNAKILSVRVLGDDNLGTISSIVAGISSTFPCMQENPFPTLYWLLRSRKQKMPGLR